MHIHFLFFFYFFLLGLAQPTWAGLDPASPARSLAQASDPAGQKSKKAGNELKSKVNSNRWIKMKSGEREAYLPGSSEDENAMEDS